MLSVGWVDRLRDWRDKGLPLFKSELIGIPYRDGERWCRGGGLQPPECNGSL